MTIDLELLQGLTPDEQEQLLAQMLDNRRFNRMEFWTPYPKQQDFFALGTKYRERLLIAGNQLGKSECGAYELACHLTGFYPPDWPGFKYVGPTSWWAAGVSTTVVRDVQQTKLCGPPGSEEEFGTGFIPKHCFAGKPTIARGAVANAYDTVQVYHHTPDGIRDGISTLQFKSYEQGRSKFQGSTLTGGVWWDEEPPADVYTEGNTRWSATNGRSFMTFTPLEGSTDVVLRFLEDTTGKLAFIKFRAEECAHMTPERIADLKAKYPRHEWEARLNGEPFMGSGRVFQTPEELITFPRSTKVLPHWALIWGIDFGITHPFAAVLMAYDRDEDVCYILSCYKAANELPLVHSQAIRSIAADVPVAWPHDGHAREKGTGEALAAQYKRFGLKMLPTHAQFPDKSLSTEAAVLEMDHRFASRRLLVREDLADFFSEYRAYHRKDGLLVKLRDDLLSATMKAIMMKRFARTGVGRPDAAPYDPSSRARLRPTRRPDVNPWTGRPEPLRF